MQGVDLLWAARNLFPAAFMEWMKRFGDPPRKPAGAMLAIGDAPGPDVDSEAEHPRTPRLT